MWVAEKHQVLWHPVQCNSNRAISISDIRMRHAKVGGHRSALRRICCESFSIDFIVRHWFASENVDDFVA
jgi:hypothetical protein